MYFADRWKEDTGRTFKIYRIIYGSSLENEFSERLLFL